MNEKKRIEVVELLVERWLT